MRIAILLITLCWWLFSVENLCAQPTLHIHKKTMPFVDNVCVGKEAYFKFNHHYKDKQNVIYAMSAIVGAETDLVAYPQQMKLPLGDSKIYRVSFMDPEWSTVFGVVHSSSLHTSVVKSICEVAISCECIEQRCAKHISSNGIDCLIGDTHSTGPYGTKENPYVVFLS